MAIERVLRSAKSFFAGTVLSRISGLLRDVAMAVSFGSSPEVAAFMVSYRLANLFRRLLGEGNLQAGFVPHFVEMKEKGPFYYRDVTYSMAIVLLLAVLLLEGLFWGCRFLVNDNWIEIIDLSMWMVPGLFFICLYGLNSALYQCHKKYFLPAVAPVAFNFIWIGAALFLPGVRWLAIAITLAFAGQWLLTLFEGAKLLTFKEWLRPQIFSPDFRALIKPMMLGIIGIGAVQFNSALDAIFARLADPEGPAFLWYAIRIQQLPMALFGIALSGALLPPLSKTKDPTQRRQLLQSALKHSAPLMFVCTFGIFALGSVGVNLLYGHGDFTPAGVEQTVACLCGYGLGLTPSVFVLLLAAGCYAQKNYRLPTRASLLSVAANIALNALFVYGFGWGAASIAIATSISSLLNMAILSQGVFQGLAGFLLKMVFISALPAVAVWIVQAFWMEPYPREFSLQLMQFGILSALYLAGVAGMAVRFKITELLQLVVTPERQL